MMAFGLPHCPLLSEGYDVPFYNCFDHSCEMYFTFLHIMSITCEFDMLMLQTPRIMEGKTDSRVSGDLLLQGADVSADHIDRVRTAWWCVGDC